MDAITNILLNEYKNYSQSKKKSEYFFPANNLSPSTHRYIIYRTPNVQLDRIEYHVHQADRRVRRVGKFFLFLGWKETRLTSHPI